MSTVNKVLVRPRPLPAFNASDWPDVPPTIQRIYAGRGVLTLAETEFRLSKLLPVSLLGGIDNAAALLAQAIMNDRVIMIAGDYDCDGATGTATGYRGLRMLGCKHLNFSIPNRFRHGYGVSPELVADMQPTPDLILTVDSGVSSVEGVAAAKARGITVVITDHHLPPEVLPDADAIVNPNLVGDPFPSKMLAGVGVMFYVLMATCRQLRLANWFTPERPEPNLTELLDLVAVGTIADLVPLDANNRLLVEAGLRRIRAGRCMPGLLALIRNGKRDHRELVASDIAFAIGPRINAAGRLEDMRVGVLCLTASEPALGQLYANQLEEINTARKERQQEMIGEAETLLEATSDSRARGVVVYDPRWHPGIVGLVASKLKESLYRPVIALAPAEPGSTELRGSARSITGFHLRDALAIVDARHPGMMKKFGGHAMAAGLSMHIDNAAAFGPAFAQVAEELLTDEMLEAIVATDGELEPAELSVGFAKYLAQWGPWGQAFPEPCFEGTFVVDDFRVLKEVHLKLTLIDPRSGVYVDAIQFGGYKGVDPPERVRLAFELGLNTYRDNTNVQLMVRHLEAA